MLTNIADIIILIAAVVVAITNILRPLVKGTTWWKQKEEERLNILFNQWYETMLKDHFEAMSIGMQSTMRMEILELYNKHCEDKTLTIREKQTLDEQFKAYTALGGNGTIKELKENEMDKWKVIV